MEEKLCPACGEKSKKRKRVDGKLVCPACLTEIVIREGEWAVDVDVPLKQLTQKLVKEIQKKQDNIFPYTIPSHMLTRTRIILKNSWQTNFPIMERRGLTENQAIDCYAKSFEELVSKEGNELGILLWHISSKDTNKFQRILTKHTRSSEQVNVYQAEQENWLDY